MSNIMDFFVAEYAAMQLKNETAEETVDDVSVDSDIAEDEAEENDTPEVPVEDTEEDIEDISIEDGVDSTESDSKDDDFSVTVDDVLNNLEDAANGTGEDSTEEKEDKEVNHRILQDFGNKIDGARKEIYGIYQRSLEMLDEENVFDSLSKAWPAPDYAKLLESGIESWKVSAIRALRESIPNRSKRGYRVTWKDLLVEKRKLAIDILKDNHTKDSFICYLNSRAEKFENFTDDNFADQDSGSYRRWGYALHQFMLYDKLGHKNNLNQYYLCYNYRYIHNKGYALLKKVPTYEDACTYSEKISYTGNYGNFGVIASGLESIDDIYTALESELNLVASNTTTSRGGSKRLTAEDFLISKFYNDESNKWYIYGFKGNYEIVLKTGFDKYSDAYKYKHDHLQELVDSFKLKSKLPAERTDNNREREGKVYRTNNEDITPEKFQETFGFYGVQFGNWVEGKLRQEFVNRTYDALLDLATAIKVPPKALSLNGTLGLSFGGRGRGGRSAALAHYEPTFTTINLTKKKGAGCLAHEWFHALDNYLGRKENKQMATDYYDWREYRLAGHDMVTTGETQYKGILESFKNRSKLRHDLVYGICDSLFELRNTKVFSRSASLDKSRSKPYWSTTIEVMARSFEKYVKETLKEQGITNDFLVNIKDEKTWKNETSFPYVYPTDNEYDTVKKGFNSFFTNLKSRTLENGNEELFSCSAHDTIGSQLEACKPISKHNLNHEQIALLQFSQEELGLPVAFYDGPETLHGKFSPDEGIMYLNRNSEMNLEWTFYHEVFHALKYQEPELYRDLLDFVETDNIVTREQIESYRIEHKAKDLPDDIVKEEMLANAFADKKTGNSIVYRMANKKPNLAVRFMRFTKNVALKAVSFFKNEPLKGELSASQFEAFSKRLDMITETMAVKGVKPLARVSNILLPNGQSITTDDVREVSNTTCTPFRKAPDKQAEYDKHIATQFTKRYPQKLIEETLLNNSPLGRKPGYVTEIISSIKQNKLTPSSVR